MSGIIGAAGSKSGVIGTTELDYEEGTFTVTFRFGGEGGSSEGTSTGHYTKIGGIVHIDFYVSLGSSNVGSGHMNPGVTGLPFFVRKQSGSTGIVRTNDRIETAPITARFSQNEKYISFYKHPTSTGTYLSTMTDSSWGTGAGRGIGVTAWYYCDIN